MHKRHIVFRSQGGLDYDLNLIPLSLEDHEGSRSPHHDKSVDLNLKLDLQERLFELFDQEEYNTKDIANQIGKSLKYTDKHFRKVKNYAGTYKKEDIIRKLMGGKLY